MSGLFIVFILLTKPELADGASFVLQFALGIPCLCPLKLELQVGSSPDTYVDSEDSNSGPHTCHASVLAVEHHLSPGHPQLLTAVRTTQVT